MFVEVVEKGPFRVVGKALAASTKERERIPQFWDQHNADGTVDALFEGCGELGVMGVCMDDVHHADHTTFTYLIAAERPEGPVPDGFVAAEIPAASWAIFEGVGPLPGAIHKVWDHIFAEWFPTAAYQHTGGPELEIYLPGDPAASDYRSQVWIPVKPK